MWYICAFLAIAVILLFRSRLFRHTVLLTKAQYAFAARLWPQAETLYRGALATAPGKPDANYSRHCRVQLARIRYRRGDLAEAQALLQESLAGWTPNAPQVLEDLCIGHVTWGQLCLDQGRYSDAHTHLTTALQLREKTGNRASMIMELQTLGDLLLRQEDFDEAERVLKRSNETEVQVVHQSLSKQGKDPGTMVVISMSQPDVYFSRRQWAEALQAYTEKVVHWEKSLTRPDNVDLGHLQMRLGAVQERLDDTAGAIETYRYAACSFERDWTENHPRVAFALSRLAQALNHAGQSSEARTAAQRALDLFDSNDITSHPEAAPCRRVLELPTR